MLLAIDRTSAFNRKVRRFKKDILWADVYDFFAIKMFEEGRLSELVQLEEIREWPVFATTEDMIVGVLDRRAAKETFSRMKMIYRSMVQAIELAGSNPDMLRAPFQIARRFCRETRRSA